VDLFKTATHLVGRAGLEARYAATLVQAAGPGVALTPPLRLLDSLRAFDAYGPLGAAITLATAAHGDHRAIVDDRGSLTFAELDRRSNALANELRERGVGPGAGLGIMARNHRGLFESIFAGAKLGARTLLLNTDFAGPQLAEVCRTEDITVLIHDAEFTDIASTAEPSIRKYVAWVDDGATASEQSTLDELIAAGSTSRPPKPARKQRIVLLTSGTTGTPKGAPRDMALSLALPGGYLSKIPFRSGRVAVLAAPAFHAWGLLSSSIALGLGNTLVLTRKGDPKWTLDSLEQQRADVLISVPILLSRLLDAGEQEIRSRDLSQLRVVALSGSALPAELAGRAMDLLGDVVYNLYGSTEVAYATIATPRDLRAAPGTVGRAPAGTTVRLFDEDGEPTPPGGAGRIFVGSAMQFEGYTGGGSKEVLAGLMSTGDIGHFDGAGRLFIDGRDDDMIVSGGENVFPDEVEDLLGGLTGVHEAAVVGVDDESYGKRLRAYIVRDDGAELTADDVKGYVKSNLARFKVPRDVVFVDDLPRNPAGKVVKRQLLEPDPNHEGPDTR
jgi:fatty-acyl-CoA synthase